MSVKSLVLCLALCASLTARVSASTIIVDVNGSGQFTDIPSAIVAAQNGDVIVVLPGTYGGFGLTKSLTIIGTGTVTLNNGGISIGSIPAGARAVVVNFRTTQLSIGSSAGHVIVQDVTGPQGYLLTLDVSQCADVRLDHVPVGTTMTPSLARIEMTRCTVHGRDGSPSHPSAGWGVDSLDGNRLHLALTSVIGGTGADSICCYAGPGGGAVFMEHNDKVIFAGGGIAQLLGGDGGFGPDNMGPHIPCHYNGPGASAVGGWTGSDFEYSGGTIQGGNSWQQGTCAPLPEPGIASAGTVTAVAPDDPTLDLVGTPTSGSSVQFVVRAPPGSIASLNLGRAPVVIADGLAEIEQLATHARTAHLGVVPASGQVTVTWSIPAALHTGALVVLQADVVLATGQLRRTNSLPLVVR